MVKIFYCKQSKSCHFSRYRDNYGGPIRRERGGYHDRGHPYQTDDRYRRNRSYGEYDEASGSSLFETIVIILSLKAIF